MFKVNPTVLTTGGIVLSKRGLVWSVLTFTEGSGESVPCTVPDKYGIAMAGCTDTERESVLLGFHLKLLVLMVNPCVNDGEQPPSTSTQGLKIVTCFLTFI